MFFSRALFAGIALLSFVSAQDPKVAFTSVPAVVSGGETYNITWGGGAGTSVTITLRKGDPDDLDTIGILADGVEGYSYNWTVSRSLEAGDDYALQITQGLNQINYSGQFSLVASNMTSTTSAVAGASTSMSSNSTMTTTMGLGGSNSTANSTMSTSSLPRTITTTPATSAHTPSASGSTNTAGGSSGAPTASGSAAESTSAPDSGAMQITSSAAFAVAVIAAVMFLS